MVNFVLYVAIAKHRGHRHVLLNGFCGLKQMGVQQYNIPVTL